MQTIGERLEDARKKKGISIREAAEATKIRGEYLQKFEGNQFEIGLTDIYTRGFLRGYANYLRIPSDRLLNDYTALRGGEPRPRQPSREVYGRMDLAISSADERSEPPGEAPAPEAAQRPHQARFQRPGENLPKGPALDPALVFKGGIVLVCAVLLLVAFWIIKSFAGSGGSPGEPRSVAHTASEITDAPTTAPAAVVSIVALQPVRVKLVRKSDGVELFQGQLQAGERREYPNVPIYLTASDLSSVELEYKGRPYSTGHTGHDRIQFDFSSR
jgi:transcriptional regulator with XRE-family HTH domain